MFTQCSKCETVFRLSADALRTAGGQVRCGRCGEVFDALSRLAEDTNGFAKGESPLFLEARAEEILESNSSDLSTAPLDIESSDAFGDAGRGDEIDLTPGADVAQLQFIGTADDELASHTSLEFTPPHPEALAVHPESAPGAHPESSPGAGAESVLMPMPPPRRAPLSRNTGLEVSEALRQEMLSSLRAAPLRGPTQSRSRSHFPVQSEGQISRRRLPFAAWLTAAILLGILLVSQVLRGNGDWIAAHVPWLGGSGSTIANLSVYQLRQWGVTGVPGANGTLRMRASILNTAPQLQPYPLLRVTLADRFGTRVATREFEPAEYLGHDIALMLAPGERADATLDIADPGKDAESFEIDVCIRGTDRKIVCAGDAAARTK